LTAEAEVVVERLADGSVSVTCRGACEDVEEPLSVYEAAYLVYRGRAAFMGESGWGAAFRLLGAAGADVDVFFVFMDLRRRGRRPSVGLRRRTLVYRHGSGRYEVLVLSEGYPVKLEDLVEWSRVSASDGYTPIIAVVDRHGIVTYYEARAVTSLS